MKKRTTLTVSEKLLQSAHERNINISRVLESALESALQGNGSQQQPQLEQPETPKELDLKSLFPPEALEKLKSLGFDVADNNLLRKIVENALNSYVLELELVDDMRNAKIVYA